MKFVLKDNLKLSEIQAMFHQQFNQAGIVREHIRGPRLDVGAHAFVEVLKLERHARMLARVLTQ